MSRYIDADLLDFPDRYIKAANAKASLHNYFRGLHFEQMCVAIDETPSADVVEVVRCKDCKWWNGIECQTRDIDVVDVDDFCSYGERKEQEHE